MNADKRGFRQDLQDEQDKKVCVAACQSIVLNLFSSAFIRVYLWLIFFRFQPARYRRRF
jgi:hypothetical protein